MVKVARIRKDYWTVRIGDRTVQVLFRAKAWTVNGIRFASLADCITFARATA